MTRARAAAPVEVVIADDEPALRAMVADYLGTAGMSVLEAADATDLERLLRERPARIVLLDINMPGEDGLSAARRLRARGERAGIIMLTAQGEEASRLAGLGGGADDYVVKPFALAELLARITAVLRRLPDAAPQPVAFGAAQFDRAARRLVAADGRVAELSAADLALLEVFLRHPRQTMSRERLCELANGRPLEAGERSIDIRVTRLRKLVELDPAAPRAIVTVRGEGYLYQPRA